MPGVEPESYPWKGDMLPLHHMSFKGVNHYTAKKNTSESTNRWWGYAQGVDRAIAQGHEISFNYRKCGISYTNPNQISVFAPSCNR